MTYLTLRTRPYLCAFCVGNEIASWELESGKRIGVGCLRRFLARAGFAIGWAIK